MTAAIFNIRPEQVIVAMDTLAVDGEKKTPFFFTTKFYLLPHLHGAMFVTGVGDFATQWFLKLERFVVRDIHHLDEHAPPALKELGKRLGLNEDLTTTVYHVGYSERESRYVGFAYRSRNTFRSERLEYGLHTKPGIVGAAVDSFPDDFIRIMEQQRAEDAALPTHQRVFIGGEIQALVLQGKSMIVSAAHRFHDYELLYAQMCDALPANSERS